MTIDTSKPIVTVDGRPLIYFAHSAPSDLTLLDVITADKVHNAVALVAEETGK